jgi:hypothetical protein
MRNPPACALLLLAIVGAVGAAGPEPGGAGLAVRVVAARDGTPLPARLVVRDAGGKAVESRYAALPGVFTDEQGRYEMPLRPGAYTLEVQRGIDSVSETRSVTVRPGAVAEVTVRLEPWLCLREKGWANGDAHAHLYTDTDRDQAMLATVRRICRAQGVDFLCAVQTWAGFGGESWREALARVSDDRFRLLYGAEMPKYRTGHTFWFGLESTRGLFDASMDTTYENGYYQSPLGSRWTFESLPFPVVPDVETVSRLAAAEDAVAVVPHPTSWWWQKRGEVEKYVTNVAVSLPVGLLAGSVWNAMVVMGYDRDHDFYQDLWFHVLDEGYRMAPVGELDGGYPPDDRFYYGFIRTYAKVGETLDRQGLVRAVRANHTFATSGPVVLAGLDGGYEPGDVVPADGRARALRVEAFASGDRQDRLSYVVLFRNGRVHRLWDLRALSLRTFEATLDLREDGRAWYVLKAYGGGASRTPEQLDVRANVEAAAAGRPVSLPDDAGVCLTSPFYFRRPGEPVEPPPFRSKMRLRLVDPQTGGPVRGATVRVQAGGRTADRLSAPLGEVEAEVPVGSVLVLEAPGRPTLRRTLSLDYPPVRARVERLANGAWLADFGGRDRLRPGQVPWAAFGLAETRALLAQVDWTVPWQPNERDPLWEPFEKAFPVPPSDPLGPTAAPPAPGTEGVTTMPEEYRRQAERRVAEYLPRLRALVRTEDPALNAFVERVFAECVTGKLFDPLPPELPYRWFAPGGSTYLGQWLWDTMFVARAFAPLDDDPVLREVFENYWHTMEHDPAAPRGSVRHGMVPNFMGARVLRDGRGWPPVGYSQIPILGWGVLGAYRQTHDRALVERALPRLVDFDEWYSRERDVDGDGLVEYGAYEAVERNSLLQTARFETFDFHLPLDGMAMTSHPRRPDGGAFYGNVEGVEQTSFLLMTERAIAEIARELGRADLADRYERTVAWRVEAMRRKMWDPQSEFFYSLDRDSDRPIQVRTIQGFLTLAAGVPTAEQAASLARQLADPRRWWTDFPVPTAALDEPKFDPRGYWRGDMWPPTTYLVAFGLRRYGHHDLALELTRRLRALVEARGIAEHYDSRTGDPLGVPGLGMSSTVWSAIVENVYGVQDDFRTVRVPTGAAGRWLRLGKLEVAYPSDRAVEIRTGFDREMTVAFADGSAGGAPRVACGGRRLRPRLGGGGVSFTARPGETCRVERPE